MKHSLRLISIWLWVVWLTPLAAQTGDVIIKPYLGYMTPKLSDVNDKINSDIRLASDIFNEPIPHPGELGAKSVFGAQLEYHINEELFLNVNVGFYRDQVSTSYVSIATTPESRFNYERKVSLYDVIFNVHYYLGYSSWKSFNKFIGFGVGLSFANAESLTQLNHPDLELDSRGEFSGNILSGVLAIGGDLKVANPLKFWAEFGLQFGNFGELDGTVTTLENPQRRERPTDSQFDFTGFYLRGGIAVTVGFLK